MDSRARGAPGAEAPYAAQTLSRQQLKRAVALNGEDLKPNHHQCRRFHNQLGFAYQVAFVRLFNRFPKQQPFEILDELVSVSAAQWERFIGVTMR